MTSVLNALNLDHEFVLSKPDYLGHPGVVYGLESSLFTPASQPPFRAKLT